MSADFNDHPSAERLQAFLDGDLPEREGARVEEHVGTCVRCAEELASWKVLFEDLDELAPLVPCEGFATRVMAGVHPPISAVPASAHPSVELLQEYLDGVLPGRSSAGIEAHLAACGSCSAEADAWSAVIAHLEGLDRIEPAPDFADRVMAAVALPEPTPLLARVTGRVRALARASLGHVDAGRLQDFVDGALPARQATRIRMHLDGCSRCAGEAEVWSGVLARLGALERFGPAEDFADRVMAAVRLAETAPSAAPALAPAARIRSAWSRGFAVARRFVPQTRQAWAALSGIAVTPAVTAGLVLYAVFSHPTLTPGALVSFVGWQLADLASTVWGAVSSAVLQSAQLFGLYSVFEALSSAPVAVAGGALVYSLLSALALRVLYKNVFAHRPTDGRYVSAS